MIGSPEAGNIENRLSINPNDPQWKDALADVKDGGVVEATVSMTQISPGEFEVTGLEVTSAPEAADEEEGEPAVAEGDEMPPEPLEEAGGVNQAVRRFAKKMRPA